MVLCTAWINQDMAMRRLNGRDSSDNGEEEIKKGTRTIRPQAQKTMLCDAATIAPENQAARFSFTKTEIPLKHALTSRVSAVGENRSNPKNIRKRDAHASDDPAS